MMSSSLTSGSVEATDAAAAGHHQQQVMGPGGGVGEVPIWRRKRSRAGSATLATMRPLSYPVAPLMCGAAPRPPALLMSPHLGSAGAALSNNYSLSLQLMASSTDDIMARVATLMQDVSVSGRALTDADVSLLDYTKAIGLQLEMEQRDCLDDMLPLLRDIVRNPSVDYQARLSLLELFELRNYEWCSSENHSSYYRQRYTELQMSDYQHSRNHHHQQQQQQHNSSTLHLEQGEIVKPSGRFAKPTRVPNKKLFKDEVVIRASDSGKVMGVKGKRIKILEELSGTVISFQRAWITCVT